MFPSLLGCSIPVVGTPTVTDVFYQVTIMPHSECVGRYGSTVVTDRMLCAASSSDRSCFTDPGGPLVVRGPDGSYTLAGIFSSGMRCSNRDDVGIFTNITAVHDWLADTMVW